MKKVFVSGPVPEAGLQCLFEDPEIQVVQSRSGERLNADDIIAGCAGCDGLLSMLYDPLDARTIARLPVRVIANFAVGYDNIDVDAASARGIAVVNTPGVLTEATADMAWALLLGAARKVGEGDRIVREGSFQGWDPALLLGSAVHGATLGILGLGRIGEAVARRAVGFGMELLYHGRTERPELAGPLGAQFVSFEELLERSDFVSVHFPLNEQTRDLLDAEALARMKSSAILVNTARGEIVDEDALFDALSRGGLAGAGIDVYAHEMDGVDPRWLTQPNTLLAPHLGSATTKTRTDMAALAAQGMLAILRDERPFNVVNPEVLDGRG